MIRNSVFRTKSIEIGYDFSYVSFTRSICENFNQLEAALLALLDVFRIITKKKMLSFPPHHLSCKLIQIVHILVPF